MRYLQIVSILVLIVGLVTAGFITPLARVARAGQSDLQKLMAERDDKLRQAYEEYVNEMLLAREERAKHEESSGDAVEAQYKYLELRSQARNKYRAAVRAIMKEYRQKAAKLGAQGSEAELGAMPDLYMLRKRN